MRPRGRWLLCAALLVAGCPGGPGGPDSYACEINSAGHCVFTGSPHALDTSKTREGFEQVQDALGNPVRPQGKPIQDGYVLAATTSRVTDADQLAYVKVFKVMAPIRDALMYHLAHTDAATWKALTRTLTENGVKTQSRNLDQEGGCGGPADPREVEYSTGDILALAQDPGGEDIHHPVMRYLEEAELALKCLWLTMDLTNPEGVDPCVAWRKG